MRAAAILSVLNYMKRQAAGNCKVILHRGGAGSGA